MNLKRRTVALASAVLLAALVGPAGAALAADADIEGVDVKLSLVRHDPAHEGDEKRERNADNQGNAANPGDAEHSGDPEEPGEQENPGDVGTPGEAEDPGAIGSPGEGGDPSEHDGSGDEGGESGDHDPCAVAAGPVSVCVDQPR